MVRSKIRAKTECKKGWVDKESEVEHCRNPWNSDCRNTEIALYIVYKGERIPLCWKCWKMIANKNIEWEA